MKIVALQATHLDSLYQIYQQATANAPHCRFGSSRAQFHMALISPALPSTQILVAEDQAQAKGFAAFLEQRIARDGVCEATITALFAQHEAAGQKLLDACVRQAQQLQAQRLSAFVGEHYFCPILSYNAGWGGLSDRVSLGGRLLAKTISRLIIVNCSYPAPASFFRHP